MEAIQQVQSIAPSYQNLAFIGLLHASMGNPGETRRILAQLQSEQRFAPPQVLGLLYMGLGNADEGFRYAELAREQQESSLIFMRVGFGWRLFRNDPRYLKLLTEIGLSDEQIQKNQHRQ